MHTWAAVPPWLCDQALRDLRVEGQVRPTLVAFAGDHLAFLALSRAFAPDDGVQALTELLALAVLFRADRVAVVYGGQARSLAAPSSSGALCPGQQVVLVAVAEACSSRVAVDCTTVPVPRVPDATGELVAGEPLATGAAEGWLPRLLQIALEQRTEVEVTLDELVRQTMRCLALGHELYLPAEP